MGRAPRPLSSRSRCSGSAPHKTSHWLFCLPVVGIVPPRTKSPAEEEVPPSAVVRRTTNGLTNGLSSRVSTHGRLRGLVPSGHDLELGRKVERTRGRENGPSWTCQGSRKMSVVNARECLTWSEHAAGRLELGEQRSG